MGRFAGNAPFTEPFDIDCVFVTGIAIQLTRHVLQLVGWTELPSVDETEDERRVVMRIAVPLDVAADLQEKLARLVSGPRHNEVHELPSAFSGASHKSGRTT